MPATVAPSRPGAPTLREPIRPCAGEREMHEHEHIVGEPQRKRAVHEPT